jgi:Tfp pilus assembly ATPase PilU
MTNEELERVFDKFPKNRMEILLGDFNANVEGRIFYNQQLGTRVYTKLYTNYNGVRAVNYTT